MKAQVVQVSTNNSRGKRNNKAKRRKNQNLEIRVTGVKGKPTKKKRERNRKVMLSECASCYLAALSRPFSTKAWGACLPFPPDTPSLKATGIQRTNIVADAAGICWVMITPTIAKDKAALWSSVASTTVPFTVATKDTAPAGYATALFGTLPFTESEIVNGTIAGRVVSYGVRITYTGPVSDMSGLFFSYANADYDNVNSSNYTITNILGSTEIKTKRVSAAAFEIAYTVRSPDHYPYVGHKEWSAVTATGGTVGGQRATYPWCSNVDINGKGPNIAGYIDNGAAIAIVGVTGAKAGTNFYVEVIEHVEYVGRGASYGLTPSQTDHNAASLIQTAASAAASGYEGSEKPWSATVVDAMKSVNPNTAMNVIGSAYKAYRGYKALSSRASGALMIGG